MEDFDDMRRQSDTSADPADTDEPVDPTEEGDGNEQA